MTTNFSKTTSFVPVFKSKRRDLFRLSLDPFPSTEGRGKFQAVFNGFSIEVSDQSDIKKIFNSGCYGRGSNSRSTPFCIRNFREEDEPPFIEPEVLILSHEEAFFLMYFLDVLEIKDIRGNVLSSEDVFTAFKALNSYFTRRMVGYIYLKSKNWVIRDGMKFGSDFIIYKKSIRIFHASFTVHVIFDVKKSQKDLQGQHRSAENAGKDLLYLIVHPPNEEDSLASLEKYKVEELIIRRFNVVSLQTK